MNLGDLLKVSLLSCRSRILKDISEVFDNYMEGKIGKKVKKIPSKIEIALALSDKMLIAIFIVVVIVGTLLVTGIISSFVAAIIGIGVGVIFMVVLYKIIRAQLSHLQVGAEALIGKKGKVTTPLNLEGMIMVEGEYWSAVGSEPIGEGEEVEVICSEGLLLKVKKAGSGAK